MLSWNESLIDRISPPPFTLAPLTHTQTEGGCSLCKKAVGAFNVINSKEIGGWGWAATSPLPHTTLTHNDTLNPCWESVSLIKNPPADTHTHTHTHTHTLVHKHHFRFHALQSEHAGLISINPYLRNGQLLNCVFFFFFFRGWLISWRA